MTYATTPHNTQNPKTRSTRYLGPSVPPPKFNSPPHILDPFRFASHPPPRLLKDSLDDHREPNNRHDQNRPHNGVTLVELVDQPITADQAATGFFFGSRRRALGSGRCRA